MAEFMSFEMKTVGKAFSTNFALEGPLAGVTSKVPSEFADFNAGVVAEGAFEGFLASMLVPSVACQFARSHKRHFAAWLLTFVRFHPRVRVYMIP